MSAGVRPRGIIDQEAACGWVLSIREMQAAVFVMAGGGLLGRMAAEQPAYFYIDTRAGRLPYRRAEIAGAVRQLIQVAKAGGLDPKNLPPLRLPNLGVF